MIGKGAFWTLFAATILVAIARGLVPVHPLSWVGTYQAFAHLLMGLLIGLYLATQQKTWLVLVIFLCAVEVVAFIAGRL